jgi:hypothetical protein
MDIPERPGRGALAIYASDGVEDPGRGRRLAEGSTSSAGELAPVLSAADAGLAGREAQEPLGCGS